MEEKEKDLEGSIESFFNQFDKKDLYTQVILEMIFEELSKKYEK